MRTWSPVNRRNLKRCQWVTVTHSPTANRQTKKSFESRALLYSWLYLNWKRKGMMPSIVCKSSRTWGVHNGVWIVYFRRCLSTKFILHFLSKFPCTTKEDLSEVHWHHSIPFILSTRYSRTHWNIKFMQGKGLHCLHFSEKEVLLLTLVSCFIISYCFL